MTKLELLSPAKNLECGIAAIDHGADAVYIGATRFGARAAADNSVEDIATLCDYAHQFDAKVYVTVNTLLHDDELEEAAQLCHDVTQAGADAILIQDLRLLNMVSGFKFQVSGENNSQLSTVNSQLSTDSSLFTLHSSLENVSFHASTQTDNRTIDAVLLGTDTAVAFHLGKTDDTAQALFLIVRRRYANIKVVPFGEKRIYIHQTADSTSDIQGVFVGGQPLKLKHNPVFETPDNDISRGHVYCHTDKTAHKHCRNFLCKHIIFLSSAINFKSNVIVFLCCTQENYKWS